MKLRYVELSRAIGGWSIGVDIYICVKLVKQLDIMPVTATAAGFTGKNLHRLEAPVAAESTSEPLCFQS